MGSLSSSSFNYKTCAGLHVTSAGLIYASPAVEYLPETILEIQLGQKTIQDKTGVCVCAVHDIYIVRCLFSIHLHIHIRDK